MVLLRSARFIHTVVTGIPKLIKEQVIPRHVAALQGPLLRYIHVLRPIPGFELSTNEEGIRLEKVEKQEANKDKRLRLIHESKTRPPLIVLLPWLMSKPKHIKKFSNYYLGHGFDVLSVRTTPGQTLWPVKGSQLVAADLVSFLELNPQYDQLLIHGFSVGGYIWGEVLVRLTELGISRGSPSPTPYEALAARIRGCIWDSACEFTELPRGVAKALFPNQNMLQNALESYAKYHMKVFHEKATQHHIRASQLFHSAAIRSPALLLFSKSDPIGTAKANIALHKEWTDFGIKVYTKCWEKSAHVAHYLNHPHEYIAEVTSFLQSINLIPGEEKNKTKMKVTNV
ncbi:transmembrane protein 53-B-like [Hetaerina americana]|uniref:transmembrane protein 53-B-like n=1 Tax=Hetaerina americana TaxID=62018 RepID=UPI003A7F4384